MGRFATPRHGFTASASGVLGGEIEGRDVSGGAGLALAYTYLPLFEGESLPFIALSGIASAALVRAEADDSVTRSWTAVDFRLGAIVGKSFLEGKLVAYAATRLFAGPVFWRRANEDLVGGDRYHITVGAGASWTVSSAVTLSLEGMPLGEQAASGGVTLNF